LAKSEFEPSPLMSTYLVALIISDFKCLSDTLENAGEYGKIDIRMCARGDAVDNGFLDYSFQSAAKILKYYEALLGMKYPLPKIGKFDSFLIFFAIQLMICYL
jgi:aminopeptidase N